MTPPKYNITNKHEVMRRRPRLPVAASVATKNGSSLVIAKHAEPARREAKTYFQIVASTAVAPSWIGFPAYQNAGSVSMREDTLQATAIPEGPHGNAKRKSVPVTANSTIPQ